MRKCEMPRGGQEENDIREVSGPHNMNGGFIVKAKVGTERFGTGEVWIRILNTPMVAKGSRDFGGRSRGSRRPKRRWCRSRWSGGVWEKVVKLRGQALLMGWAWGRGGYQGAPGHQEEGSTMS